MADSVKVGSPRTDPLGWAAPVRDFLDHVHGTLAPRTEEFYAQRLGLLVAWAHEQAEDGQGVDFADFKARHLRQYLAHRADVVSPLTQKRVSTATRRHDAISARVFFRFCAREGHVAVDPLHGFVLPRADRPFVPTPCDAEAQAILRACRDRWLPAKNPAMRYVPERRRRFFAARNYALLTGLMATGARVGELLALTMEDWQPAQMRIVIRQSKGREPRIVPVGEEWAGVLDTYLGRRPRDCPSDRLFVTDEGRPMTPLLLRQQYYKDADFAGLPVRYTLQSLRHYCLTRLAEVSVFAAQSVAGHKDLRTTRGYLHVSEQHTRETMERADPLGRLMGTALSARAARKRLV